MEEVKNQTAKNRFFIFSTLLNFLSVVFVLYILFNFVVIVRCISSFKYLPPATAKECLRIKIYGSSSSSDGNTVSATFSILDSNENEIAVIERSWKGNYLCVEFEKASYKNKSYIFPSRIYGKDRIFEESGKKGGTSLEKYFDDDAQCMLLGSDSTYKERTSLYNVAIFATHKYPVWNFSLTQKMTVDLSLCKTDVYYSVIQNENGGLELHEL